MKILGLLLVLGIGIFLMWFFEEIFKDSSEEGYEDYEYEMPRRAARAGALSMRTGARGVRPEVRSVHPEVRSARSEVRMVRPEVRSARSEVRVARTACSSMQAAASGRPVCSTSETAWISAGRDRRDVTRIPSGAGRRDMAGQSCRKSA